MINTSMTDKIYDDLDIRQFKLTSGENVLGLITGVDKVTSMIMMERPVTLISETLKDSKQRFFFADWMPVARKDVVGIAPNHVISQAEVDSRIKESYIKYCLTYDRELYDDEEDDDDYDNELLHTTTGSDKIH